MYAVERREVQALSDDNVVSFPGTSLPEKEAEPRKSVTADDLLAAAIGEFEDVIIVGIKSKTAQCLSTVALQQIVYEMSRVTFKIHEKIDLK